MASDGRDEHVGASTTPLRRVPRVLAAVGLRIVLVSVGAAAMLGYLGNGPGLQSAGTLLTLALFATDPSTMPKGAVAKVLFGAFIGAGIIAFSRLLQPTGAGKK